MACPLTGSLARLAYPTDASFTLVAFVKNPVFSAQVPETFLRSASRHFTEIFVFADGTIGDGHARDRPHRVQPIDHGERLGRAAAGTRSAVQPLDPAGLPAGPQARLDPVPRHGLHGRRMGSHRRTRTGP